MFQVFIVRSGDGRAYSYGQPVSSLRAATKTVKELDAAFAKWEAAGYPEGAEPAVLHYEGCDVLAVEVGGKQRQWSLDEDEWQQERSR